MLVAQLIAGDERDEQEAHQDRYDQPPPERVTIVAAGHAISTTSPAPSRVRTITMPGPNERRYSRKDRGTGGAAGSEDDASVMIPKPPPPRQPIKRSLRSA